MGRDVGPVGGVKRVVARRWRVRRDGFESPVDEADVEGEGDGEDGVGDGSALKETFDITWAVRLGGVPAEWEIRGLTLAEGGTIDRSGLLDEEGGEQGLEWRERFWNAKKELVREREEARRVKDALLDAVLGPSKH